MVAAFDGGDTAGGLAACDCVLVASCYAGCEPVHQPEGHLTARQRRPAAAAEPGDPQVPAFYDRCVTIMLMMHRTDHVMASIALEKLRFDLSDGTLANP